MTGTVLTTADRLEVAELSLRYAAYVDERDFDAAGRLFADDGVLVAPDPPRSLDPVLEAAGPHAITDVLARLRELRRTVHAVTGVVLDATGADTVRGRVTGTAHHVTERDGGPVDLVWHVRYADSYARTGAGWRFTRRAVHVDLIEPHAVLRVRER